MRKPEIDKLSWLHIVNEKLLVVRSKGNDVYYIPGGKRDVGETDQAALMREIKEELSIDLQPNTIEYAGTFKAQAHGKPEGVMVKITCYCAEFSGVIAANNEIEEMRWITYDDRASCSLVTQFIMDKLFFKKLLTSRNSSSEKQYQYILFDADNTLFHFDDFRGLVHMFWHHHAVEFTHEDYQAYQAINKPLWSQYEKGEITAQELQHQRFKAWADKLNVSTETLNHHFLTAMAETCSPMQGARALLNALKSSGKKLVIITNGFVALHAARLQRTELNHFIDFLVVSEAVGVAKPHQHIFEHALNLLGNPTREEILMVGDTPASDIQGGHNIEVDTCWFNSDEKKFPENIRHPTYEVSSLCELQYFLLGKPCPVNAAHGSSDHAIWAQSRQNSPSNIEISPVSAKL